MSQLISQVGKGMLAYFDLRSQFCEVVVIGHAIANPLFVFNICFSDECYFSLFLKLIAEIANIKLIAIYGIVFLGIEPLVTSCTVSMSVLNSSVESVTISRPAKEESSR